MVIDSALGLGFGLGLELVL